MFAEEFQEASVAVAVGKTDVVVVIIPDGEAEAVPIHRRWLVTGHAQRDHHVPGIEVRVGEQIHGAVEVLVGLAVVGPQVHHAGLEGIVIRVHRTGVPVRAEAVVEVLAEEEVGARTDDDAQGLRGHTVAVAGSEQCVKHARHVRSASDQGRGGVNAQAGRQAAGEVGGDAGTGDRPEERHALRRAGECRAGDERACIVERVQIRNLGGR